MAKPIEPPPKTPLEPDVAASAPKQTPDSSGWTPKEKAAQLLMQFLRLLLAIENWWRERNGD